jgi:hypothetical protein
LWHDPREAGRQSTVTWPLFVAQEMEVAPASRQVLRFSVFRAPVSTNAQYKRVSFTRMVKGKMKTINALGNSKEADDFKAAVRAHAMVAVRRQDWPQPDAVKHVAVKIVVFNTKHDCSASEKLVLDGMEHVVYHNDRVAHPRTNDIGSDDGPVRVEVTVELLRAV